MLTLPPRAGSHTWELPPPLVGNFQLRSMGPCMGGKVNFYLHGEGPILGTLFVEVNFTGVGNFVFTRGGKCEVTSP